MADYTRLDPPGRLEESSEEVWQAHVVAAGEFYGWICFHFPNMWSNESGYPDLTCFRGEEESLLIELKVRKNTLSRAQQRLADRLAAFGKTVHLLRPTPEDWERLIDLFVWRQS